VLVQGVGLGRKDLVCETDVDASIRTLTVGPVCHVAASVGDARKSCVSNHAS